MKITTEQRKQIREHLSNFSFVSHELVDRMTECAVEFELGQPSDMLWSLFCWSDTLEGHSYWKDFANRFLACEKALTSPKTKNEPKELTQADVQTLLSIVRTELEFTTNHKEGYKYSAADVWKHCSKGDEQGQDFFEAFSALNSSHKRMKQREKTLVGLITKLKGLR